MRKSIIVLVSLFFTAIASTWLLESCRKDMLSGLTPFPQQIPAGFPAPNYTFADNPVSKEGFELGKKLFYDGRLAIDNIHSCASCHQQIAAFGTFEHDRSHGVNHTHTLRNAPPLFNLAWQKELHWDGEYHSLYQEVEQPLYGDHEMGETFEGIIKKLKRDPEYPKLFQKVFKSSFITADHIRKALAQFTGNLVSANSKYDLYKKGLATFNSFEEHGYQVFKNKCASCHPEPLFTDYSYRNIGLPVDPDLNDFGRIRVTKKAEDNMKFRVPSLRNVNITSHYMHDGRFASLSQCMDHYRTGVQQSATLDPLLVNGITMTDNEALDVIRFLQTLTDSTFILDPSLKP